MTTIGYAVLQIVPSLDGVSKEIDKQLGGTVGAAGKRSGKDFAKGVGDGLKDLEREVESTGRAYQKLRDRAADALGKVRIEEARLAKARAAGRNDQIVTAEERLVKARRDSTRATREAEDGHKSLLAAQTRLGAGADNLGVKLGGMKSVAASVGPVLAAAGAAAAAAAVAGVAVLGAAAVKATSELYALGAQFDDISDTLQIKTGATGAALNGMVESVKSLGKEVPLSLGDLGNIVAETNRNLHLTGPALDDVAGTLAELGRMTGEQVDIRGLGKAFRGFGVDAKDQVPALDSLFAVSQKTGLSVNDLISTVSKGVAPLKALGFGFGEAAGLAALFEENGLDADKAMQGLTKGLGALAKSGQTGQQALKDNVDQIKNLLTAGNDAAALDLTNKLFGGKGGVQFFDLIKSGKLDLDNLSASLDGTGQSIRDTAQSTADWEERWQIFKNTAADALQPIGTAVFDNINGALTDLADWITNHQPEIIGFFTGVGEAAILMGEIVLTQVGVTSKLIGSQVEVLGTAISTVGQLIQSIAAPLQSIPSVLLGPAGRALKEFGGDLGASMTEAGDKTAEFGGKLSTLGENAYDVGTNKLPELGDKLSVAGNNAQAAARRAQELAAVIAALPGAKDININATVVYKDEAGVVIPPDQLRTPTRVAATPGGTAPTIGGGRARGGVLPGYSPGVDNMLVPMSGGEGILIPQAVRALGPGFVHGINDMFRGGYANGGVVGIPPDVAAAQAFVGTPYSQSTRDDCSGMAAKVINQALGLPNSGLMSTKTAAEWLAARGFQPGVGGPGTISVGWYDHGPNPNDGHMAMTLSDGTNAEAGGNNRVFTMGSKARGANDPAFDQHMYLPAPPSEGKNAAEPISGEGAAGSSIPASAPQMPATASAGGSGGVSIPSSLSELATAGLGSLGSGMGTAGGSDLSVFTKAAGSAISGQVSSALGVFGINDSPGWLKGISQLVGGISIGGQGSGSSAAPISARSTATGTPPPDDAGNVHGTRAGQQPGPSVVYNIAARDTEDAFIRAQRQERERAAAKLARF